MGIYIFNRQLLRIFCKMNMRKQQISERKSFRILSINIKFPVSNMMATGPISEIYIHFFEANLGLTKEIPDFNLFDNSNAIYTRARMLPPAKISGTTLEKTIIAEGCIINASRIENSVIGIRTRIGIGTTIVSSYLMGNDYYETIEEIKHDREHGMPSVGIGDRCYIRNCYR